MRDNHTKDASMAFTRSEGCAASYTSKLTSEDLTTTYQFGCQALSRDEPIERDEHSLQLGD